MVLTCALVGDAAALGGKLAPSASAFWRIVRRGGGDQHVAIRTLDLLAKFGFLHFHLFCAARIGTVNLDELLHKMLVPD